MFGKDLQLLRIFFLSSTGNCIEFIDLMCYICQKLNLQISVPQHVTERGEAVIFSDRIKKKNIN